MLLVRVFHEIRLRNWPIRQNRIRMDHPIYRSQNFTLICFLFVPIENQVEEEEEEEQRVKKQTTNKKSEIMILILLGPPPSSYPPPLPSWPSNCWTGAVVGPVGTRLGGNPLTKFVHRSIDVDVVEETYYVVLERKRWPTLPLEYWPWILNN